MGQALAVGMAAYAFTFAIVFLGVLAGRDFIRYPGSKFAKETDVVGAFCNWDGSAYALIGQHGYAYNERAASSVAFFPAYPILGRLVAATTGISIQSSLLAVSHVALACALVLLCVYAGGRTAGSNSAVASHGVLVLALWPAGLFFRMAYSESLFLALALLAFVGMQRRWPTVLLGVTVGAATATRPTGVALMLPFAIHLWQSPGTWKTRAPSLCWLPLSCWGLAAFMAYQGAAFGDPLAFARTQQFWNMRTNVSAVERALALATWEPIWTVYSPGTQAYWDTAEGPHVPVFSLFFMNPILFVATTVLILWGAFRGTLDGKETTFAAALLAIGYVTRAYEMCMASQARFATVAFPAYLVVGTALARLPVVVSTCVYALMGVLLAFYSALFAAWYVFI